MPTVEELDAKIEERRRQIARFEERKKALIAKEREQQKKWQTLVVSAIGETVIREAGCTWTDIDLDCLQSRSMSAPRICTTPWSSRDRRPQTPSVPLTGSRRHRGVHRMPRASRSKSLSGSLRFQRRTTPRPYRLNPTPRLRQATFGKRKGHSRSRSSGPSCGRRLRVLALTRSAVRDEKGDETPCQAPL